jgi:UDP-2-acetamido-2,6-beta-L-arabino-hexul-4-ose reductase
VRIGMTGAYGFLGWHTRCALKARGFTNVVLIGRRTLSDPAALDVALRDVDAVLHLAGVNRADPVTLRQDNSWLARELTASLDRVGARPVVIYANSAQSGNGTAYGDGKEAAATALALWGRVAGVTVCDVRLPNLFGEHGRPYYNSVVATFCHELAEGRTPTVIQDRSVALLHAQDAVDCMLKLIDCRRSGIVMTTARPMAVSNILDRLGSFSELYAVGEIPNIEDSVDRALFNTYRSYCFPAQFPLLPRVHSDERGRLFECLRGHGGEAQVFCSTTRPTAARGNHFHLRKIERFLVLQGKAEITLRRLFDDDVVTFTVFGERPAIVDMPTMWTHAIRNTGSGDLTTLFWADELLDATDPDTHPETVEMPSVSV